MERESISMLSSTKMGKELENTTADRNRTYHEYKPATESRLLLQISRTDSGPNTVGRKERSMTWKYF